MWKVSLFTVCEQAIQQAGHRLKKDIYVTRNLTEDEGEDNADVVHKDELSLTCINHSRWHANIITA